MRPLRQRRTLRTKCPTSPLRFSIAFVLRSVRYSAPVMPRRWSVRVSSSPSRREAAAPGVGVVETCGELLEAPLGECAVRESVGFLEDAADARPHGLWQMLEDVAAFVDLATLDDGRRPARLADRLAESGPAVDHEEHRALEIEAALAQVGEEGLADGRVLGRALAQREDVLAPLRIHAQRDEDDVIAEVQPVDEDDPDVEPVQGLGEPRGQLRARECDEAAGDATLRDSALADPRGQRVERPAVLAGRDADRDRFPRGGGQRIAGRGGGEAWVPDLRGRDPPPS